MRVMRFAFKRFDRFSRRKPHLAQIVTSAIIWGVGDYVAQSIDRNHAAERARTAASASSSSSSSSPPYEPPPYDLRRIVSCATFGGLLIAPIGDRWYRWLDVTVSRRWAIGSPAFIGVKVLLDTVVFGPAYISSFLVYSSLLNGGTLQDAWTKLNKELVPLVCVDSIIFPPLSTFNFMKVPLRHQITFVNTMSSFDAVLMSYVSACEEGFDAVLAGVKEAWERRDKGGEVENQVAFASVTGSKRPPPPPPPPELE